eukprot:427610-Prorocentrum_minimum.AAC.1
MEGYSQGVKFGYIRPNASFSESSTARMLASRELLGSCRQGKRNLPPKSAGADLFCYRGGEGRGREAGARSAGAVTAVPRPRPPRRDRDRRAATARSPPAFADR